MKILHNCFFKTPTLHQERRTKFESLFAPSAFCIFSLIFFENETSLNLVSKFKRSFKIHLCPIKVDLQNDMCATKNVSNLAKSGGNG